MADQRHLPPSGQRSAASGGDWGRRAGALVYWAGVFYFIGVGLFSVIPQACDGAATRRYVWDASTDCQRALRGLHAELRAQLADQIAGAPPEAKRAEWFRHFRDRLHGLPARCERHSAFALVGAMQRRYANALARVAREQGRLDRAVEVALYPEVRAQPSVDKAAGGDDRRVPGDDDSGPAPW